MVFDPRRFTPTKHTNDNNAKTSVFNMHGMPTTSDQWQEESTRGKGKVLYTTHEGITGTGQERCTIKTRGRDFGHTGECEPVCPYYNLNNGGHEHDSLSLPHPTVTRVSLRKPVIQLQHNHIPSSTCLPAACHRAA